MQFENREQAGQLLSQKLIRYKDNPRAAVLGIPRGGIIVAYEIAKNLNLPLNAYVSRKISSPNDPELGVGAISELNTIYLLNRMVDYLNLPKKELLKIKKHEKLELKRRIQLYRKNRRLMQIKNKIVILVDDGLAMGVTAIASILSVKKRNPAIIIFASPVCAHDNLEKLKNETGVEVVTLYEYNESAGIGHFYKNFLQTSDDEVIKLLEKTI